MLQTPKGDRGAALVLRRYGLHGRKRQRCWEGRQRLGLASRQLWSPMNSPHPPRLLKWHAQHFDRVIVAEAHKRERLAWRGLWIANRCQCDAFDCADARQWWSDELEVARNFTDRVDSDAGRVNPPDRDERMSSAESAQVIDDWLDERV